MTNKKLNFYFLIALFWIVAVNCTSYDDSQSDSCGYLSTRTWFSHDYTNLNFVSSNSFPVTENLIHVTDEELKEVIELAKELLTEKCNKEIVLNKLDIATVTCVPDTQIASASKMANLVDIIYEILAYRHNVGFYDVVKFTTNGSLPTDVCVPVNSNLGISELNRILPPYCILDDNKSLKRLPSVSALAFHVDKISQEEEYYPKTCLNSFGLFLFQAFMSDVQQLVSKSACGHQCLEITGCHQNSILCDSLLSDSIDVLDICTSESGYSCVTYEKFQRLNTDCEIRKRGPMNKATPFIDLSHIYDANTIILGNGSIAVNSRNLSSTPLQVVHNVKEMSHNAIANLLKNKTPTLNDAEIFENAKRINTYIFQRVLYEHLLPKLLGISATVQHNLNSSQNCYDSEKQFKVDVESVVVALRYSNVYIPKEYEFLTESYDFDKKRNFNQILSEEDVNAHYQDILRGLLTHEIYKNPETPYSCPKQGSKPSSDHIHNLRTMDFQAARDACVVPYVHYLAEYYNISALEDWEFYENFLPGCRTKKLSKLYLSPQDVELAVGGALDVRYDSLFGIVYVKMLGNFFNEVRCADPNFWTNALTGIDKENFANFDVQDWIAFVAGFDKRPKDLFCANSIDNPLIPVNSKSLDVLASLAIS